MKKVYLIGISTLYLILLNGCISYFTSSIESSPPADLNNLKYTMTFPFKNEIKLEKAQLDSSAVIKNYFKFIENIKSYYLLLSEDHTKFEILNNDRVVKDSIISNEENSKGQFITHKYTVVDYEPLKYMKWVSPKSKVHVKKYLFNMYVGSILEFFVNIEEKDKVVFSSKLTIAFDSEKALKLATGSKTKDIWEAHVQNEMTNALIIFNFLTESKQINNDPKTWKFDKIKSKLLRTKKQALS